LARFSGCDCRSLRKISLLNDWRDCVKLSIVVADDNPEFLDTMVSMLRTEFDVVATAADGKSALERIWRYWPDVAVLDFAMPFSEWHRCHQGSDEPSARARCGDLLERDRSRNCESSAGGGALGYVFKVRLSKDLISAVRSVSRGQPFVSDRPR
jgi:DNA-binding NarL/FixJ family response regulator